MAMTISLSDAGKRYNREWIFRHIQYNFHTGESYAITGANGSGKSTLLQLIGGALMPNEGKLEYLNPNPLPPEQYYKYVSLCAPYLELVEEMTLREFLSFHQQFKPLLPGLHTEMVIERIGLQAAADKQIRFYSSGMKQRVKLAQCLLSETSLVLLDEPCTNLDEAGITLYHQLVEEFCQNRIIVVSSNDPIEYRFASHILRISDYK